MRRIDSRDGGRESDVEHERVDVSVLVVGAGAGGARTATELAETGVDDDDNELDSQQLE